ncbi:hypothetical protein Tco_1187955 [Tanacetum coccineum]
MMPRTRLYLLKTIGSKLAFKPERYKKFRSTVFGPWLDIRTQEHDNHLINYLLQHQRNVKDPSTDIPFIFDIGPNTIEFGRRDVKGLDLNKLLNNHTEFNKLLDDDVVRICLLLALDFVFMGFELRHVIANELLGLVDDLSAWNDFPWDEYMGPTFMSTYTLQGFIFSFKIWLLETYPNSKTWWVEEKNAIPRDVAWSDGTTFLKNNYDRLFQASTSSDGPSKKKKSRVKHKSVVSHTHVRTEFHREVDVRTNVQHDVDEGLSIPNVHHDVEEG